MALVAFVAGDMHPASASCAAPRLQVEPVRLAPGEVVHLGGQGWMAECRDTWTCEVGRDCTAPEPSPPADSVAVSFEQGERSQLLVTARPDTTYAIDLEASVPADAAEGPARIVARADNGLESAPVAVEVVAPAQREPAGTTPAASEELPRTGPSGSTSLVGLGALLVACGAVMLRTCRAQES